MVWWQDGRRLASLDALDAELELVTQLARRERDLTLGAVKGVAVADHEVKVGLERLDRVVLVGFELALDHDEVATVFDRNEGVVGRDLFRQLRNL